MKACWCEESSENLKLMQLDWSLFVRRIITGDETCINHHDPETKIAKHAVETRQFSKPSQIECTGINWQDNVPCVLGCWRYTADWLCASQSNSYRSLRVYYADLLGKLLVAVKEKRRGTLTQVPLLLHDSASAHRSHVGQDTVLQCAFDEMCHPPYSPDQTPNDYHMFPK